MSNMIINLKAVTAEWLTDVLCKGGSLPRGRVDSVYIVPESSHSSTIGRLTVTYSDNAPPTMLARLFLKICHSGADERVVGNERRQLPHRHDDIKDSC